MTSELKPCPFCGGEADVLNATGFLESSWLDGMTVARCRSCKAKTNPRKSAERTAKAWNTRADAFEQPEGTFLMPLPDKPLARSVGEFDPENGTFVMSFEFVEDEVKRYSELLGEKLLDAICECRGYVPERTCTAEEKVLDTCDIGTGSIERLAMFCSECGEQLSIDYGYATWHIRCTLPNYCPVCGCKVVNDDD